ncbi:MAG: hypothetical protein R3E97_10535 [Candidatus Eisenbacteria bacterium]
MGRRVLLVAGRDGGTRDGSRRDGSGRDDGANDEARPWERDVEVIRSEEEGVRGNEPASILGGADTARSTVFAAGPGIHRLLLGARESPIGSTRTLAPRLLRDEFFTLGERPEPASRFRLRHLFLDGSALSGDGQLFACYERP